MVKYNNHNGSITRLNNPIRVVLASRSNLFLGGIYKVLEDENSVAISAQASSPEEIKKYLAQIKPEFSSLDNRTIKQDIHELISPHIIRITKETDFPELIETIKSDRVREIKPLHLRARYDLADKESEIIELIGGGFSNREIAKKLLMKEKTVKAT
jgi:DNA-binding NarL/FixJ family response regulator